MAKITPKGSQADKLRARKRELLATLRIPADVLGGSLALTHSRCQKGHCHCAQGKGHPGWSLSFMDQGEKRVERIPFEWVESVRERVERGKAVKAALAELFVINADLLALYRKEQKRQRRQPSRKGRL